MSDRTGRRMQGLWGAARALLGVALVCAPLCVEAEPEGRKMSHEQKSNPYSLGYSQISEGSGFSQSAAYSIEDAVRYPAATGKSQRSVEYGVVNPQGLTIKANNGVVIVEGTKVRITWPEAREGFDAGAGGARNIDFKFALDSAAGYQVRRSGTGAIGSYLPIGPALIFETTYLDENLARGTYFYRVFYFDGDQTWYPWTPPLIALITDGSNPVKDWMIYE